MILSLGFTRSLGRFVKFFTARATITSKSRRRSTNLYVSRNGTITVYGQILSTIQRVALAWSINDDRRRKILVSDVVHLRQATTFLVKTSSAHNRIDFVERCITKKLSLNMSWSKTSDNRKTASLSRSWHIINREAPYPCTGTHEDDRIRTR